MIYNLFLFLIFIISFISPQIFPFNLTFKINQESFKQSKASVFQTEVQKWNTPEMRQIAWLMCLRGERGWGMGDGGNNNKNNIQEQQMQPLAVALL